MILAALLVPVAVLAIVLLIERARLPVFLAIMVAVVGYGIANQMTFSSVSKAFGLGFVQTLEQVGLLVMAGAIVARLLGPALLGAPGAAVSGVLAGLGSSPAGALALLQPAASGAPRRAIALLLILLCVQALIAPAPLAVAASAVMKTELATALRFAIPVAVIAAVVGWLYVSRLLPDSGPRGRPSWTLIAIAAPIALLIVAAVAQMPTEPLGKGGAREFYTGIAGPLMLALLALALTLLATRRWPAEILADTSWAPLLLAVGAAGGLARVFDEAGMSDLLAEQMMRPELGVLAPFLAAATVKTLQGNSLSAVLTASGMTEPMLGPLGLDSSTGRALAAMAAGAGSVAVVHVNDPLFWIAAHMAGLRPRRALVVISLGSAAVAVTALVLLKLLEAHA